MGKFETEDQRRQGRAYNFKIRQDCTPFVERTRNLLWVALAKRREKWNNESYVSVKAWIPSDLRKLTVNQKQIHTCEENLGYCRLCFLRTNSTRQKSSSEVNTRSINCKCSIILSNPNWLVHWIVTYYMYRLCTSFHRTIHCSKCKNVLSSNILRLSLLYSFIREF